MTGRRFGHFSLADRLGAGAFGEVWRAWDESLSRWVALKLMKAAGAEDAARFRREAQLAARLSHPGIVQVFEVGELDDQFYIAMELVDGRSLAGRRFEPAEAARLIRDAALAMQAAHETGLVHRDLKPQNLLLDSDGRRVRVADFGLARAVEAGSTLTVSGMMVGTPAYMSPEQARGELDKIGPRSDVYGLGATLFEMLTGRPPFEGSDLLSVVTRVVGDDPPSLRRLNAAIPRELETVVFTCLQKEQADRYATASDLAADLDRFLRGEPPLAHGSSTFGRLAKTVVKRRGVLISGVVAMAAIVGLSIVLLTTIRREHDKTESAEVSLLREMRKTSQTCLEAALELRRAANLGAMEEYARRLETVCAKVEQVLPHLAEPHTLKSRIYRAQMKEAQARVEAERAVELEPADGRARYERIVLMSADFRRALIESHAEAWRRIGERILQGERRLFEETGSKDKILDIHRRMNEDLAVMERQPACVSAEEFACARALCLLMPRSEGARPLLETAARGERPLAEAIERLVELELQDEDRDTAVLRALEVLETAVARDRGYVPFLVRRASLRLDRVSRLSARGEPTEETLAAARRDIDRAIELMPARAASWETLARCCAEQAVTGPGRARAEEIYREGLQAVDRAIALDGKSHHAWELRAAMNLNLAIERLTTGQDPSALMKEAIDDSDRAIALHGRCGMSFTHRASVRVNLGGWMADHGQDPTACYEFAARDYAEAMRIAPNDAGLWHQRGMLWLHWAGYRAATGGDAASAYKEAVDDLRQSVSMQPSGNACCGLANALLLWGHLLEDAKAVTLYRSSLREATNAVKVAPGLWEGWWLRGNAALSLADRGVPDAAKLRAGAAADYDKAIALAPGRAEPLQDRAVLHANLADAESTAGRDPTPHYKAAIADLDRAIRIKPTSADLWAIRGGIRGNQATWEGGHGKDPGPTFTACLEDLAKALKINPKSVTARNYEGNAWYNWGHWKHRRGDADYKEAYRRAHDAYTECVRLDPRLKSVYAEALERLGEAIK